MKKIIIAILLALFLAFRVQAQEPIYLPVIIKMPIITPDIDNNWRIIQPQASFNYVLNPSAEQTGNFSATLFATVTRVTTFQKYGLFSYFIQAPSSGDGINLTTSTLANLGHHVTVRVRKPYPDLQAQLGAFAKTLIKIEKIDSNWDLLGIPFSAAQANGSTTLQILALASGNFYIDGIQIEPLNFPTTYIDGTQEGCAWLGSPHAAASERSGQSRAGGISYDFWEQYKFQVQKIVGAGASTHNLGVDSYAILPGGELNSDKIESRDFQIIGKFITNSEEELHEKRQELEAAFQTDDRQLTRIRFNGAKVQKEIAVRYNGGLEGDLAAFYGDIEIVTDEQYKEVFLYTERASIQVIAPNPYWLEVGESAINLDTNDSATFRIVAARLRSTGQWDVLGPPDGAGTYTDIFAVAEDDTYVYFGGDFLNFDNIANADYIVRWHKINQSWSALDVGLNDIVRALAISPSGDLLIGGAFTNAGGVAAADYLTLWDGGNFNAVGIPNTGAAAITSVFALIYDLAGNLIIGGAFINWADIANADRIVMWDGSAYSALGIGALDGTVFAFAIGLDGILFAGGSFTTMGVAADTTFIASWDGSDWSAVGEGLGSLGNDVNALAVNSAGLLYIGIAGFGSDNFILSWNGTAYSPLGSDVNADVNALAVGADDILYVGGGFTEAGGVDLADRVARWNQYVWAHLDLDLPGSPFVQAILASKFVDPVVEQNYDLFLGYDTTGTGNFAGLVEVENEGSVQAFPKIIYARSGGTSAIIETLRNETTGKELLFDYPLLDGETLTIDLEPTQKSIISSFFGSRLDAVLANSDFGTWALSRGNSDVTSFVAVAGGPTVTAYMQWRDAYSGYD